MSSSKMACMCPVTVAEWAQALAKKHLVLTQPCTTGSHTVWEDMEGGTPHHRTQLFLGHMRNSKMKLGSGLDNRHRKTAHWNRAQRGIQCPRGP